MATTLTAEVSGFCRNLVDLVRETAHEVIMPRYLTAVRNRKADGSLFTEVDLRTQQALVGSLSELRAAPVLGEEMDSAEQLRLWEEGRGGLWCIDPIDGTTNFTTGIPFFAISVAWFENGLPSVGVVYNPATQEAFYAERGHGAFLNGTRLPLRKPATKLGDAVAGIDFKRIPRALADALATRGPYYSQRNFGSSAIEWCYLAAGRLDVYLHGGQMLWDYAGGRVILDEAGGAACTLTHEDFDADNLWKRAVVAAGSPELLAQWRAWLGAHR